MRALIPHISQAQGRAPAEIPLQRQIPLLVVGKREIFGEATRRDGCASGTGERVLQSDRRYSASHTLGVVERSGEGRVHRRGLLEVLKWVASVEDPISSPREKPAGRIDIVGKAESWPKILVVLVDQA